jgi:uridine phosphorylase
MQRIAESELIINDRGAIYHLNVKPEEIANSVITVGDPARVKEVSKYFDKIEFEMQHREFITHTGYIEKKRLSVISTGIGPDNIDIVLNELDALVNIDLDTRKVKSDLTTLNIFRFGTSGSLQREIPVDGLVAATHALGLDNLMNFYRTENNEEEKQIIHAFKTHTQLTSGNVSPYIFMGSPSLLKHFVKDYHQGITVTCPGFYGPQGRVLRLGLAYPHLVDLLSTFHFGQHRISNFEMESSAIYGLGKALGHHCISLNTIVNNRITKEFTKDGAKSVENLIIKSLGIISNAGI